ncbi:hypothetical protein Clacol_004849 [Clathrus columnatus]|uniref:Creatinase/aminopeptidase n=1 Tax=Clathrus columnatus TaxID=1419009 RepID=A0AAV5A7M7_9AGAM|nr:hypothetical protein Clacol_004849 [Clathrus columnatus]
MSNAKVNTTSRLAALRELMVKEPHKVDAFVVPTEDQHSSEYIDACDARRAFISGFDGSAGTAIITHKEALLFTDGRYYLQAGKQLDDNWTLIKQGLPNVPTWQTYLHQVLPAKSRIGIDPTVISFNDVQTIEKSLTAKGSSLVPTEHNLVDQVWGNDRPPRTQNPVFTLDVKYAGVSSADKIKNLRKILSDKNASGIVINMLDEIAWLFNLRVFFAYAFVSHSEVVLYVNPSQINEDVRAHLGTSVSLKPYGDIWQDLRQFGATLQTDGQKVILGTTASFALAHAIGPQKVTVMRSPVTDAKSIKNDTEIQGFRECHIRDGSALVRYFAWLEEELTKGSTLTETQFWDGTTDVTRTWHFGTPTPQERRAFTRVLQGVIAIDTVIFPEETSGFKLHGTGHGVGHFLNVHEGPHGIGLRIAYNDTTLKAGMTVSNEPGYYEDGKFGIRIENIIIVKKVETPNNFGGQAYYGFENLTMVG